jgi:hypothetical protein
MQPDRLANRSAARPEPAALLDALPVIAHFFLRAPDALPAAPAGAPFCPGGASPSGSAPNIMNTTAGTMMYHYTGIGTNAHERVCVWGGGEMGERE